MSERKKVAILLPWLKMGGTNKIALNFMKELSQYCDVTLILSQNTGELLPQLPDNIHLIIDEMRSFRDIVKEDVRNLRVLRMVQNVLYYVRIKLHRDSVDNYRYLVQRHGYVSDEEYDCAISYHGQSPERLLNLLYRTKAKKKAAWLHGEFNNSSDHYHRMNRYYNQLDHLFFVSNHTMRSFQDKFSADENKCTVYYNPIDKQEILECARIPCEVCFEDDHINVLTVGRISGEKGQDMIPAVVRKLTDLGLGICWYIVGDGENRPTVEQLIREYGVEDRVILLGTRTNPYCYMKSCDIYVQPSYTEGYSTTICEAGILGKAIVGTKPSGGIYDQITHGEDGLIVDATVDGLTEGIRILVENTTLRRQFEKNIQKKNFEGKGEIEKFLGFLNSE